MVLFGQDKKLEKIKYYYNSQTLDSTIVAGKDYIKQDKFNTDVFLYLGKAYYLTTQFDSSLAYLEKYFSTPKFDLDAAETYFELLDKKGDYASISAFGKKNFSKGLTTFCYGVYANALIRVGEYSNAYDTYRALVVMDEASGFPELGAGKASMMLGNWSEAKFNFEESIRKKSNNPEAYQGLALTLINLKEYDKICDNLKKAKDLGYADPQGLYDKNCASK